ncbi:NAD-dependent epimerase/dehydratase family protein [Marinoscillum furvescens]|uniref:UDP-glucose 4-epimerase n=1 Tax=Marinoscillum furvescens DSM 4134 TaxID=1122208 RepID=A0A3D9L6Z5_MARFU|nr:NAD-dependent epimerase/dehydratase [Marinoscillum furvescens]REE01254.1 UDP-glucose 4-epimerase [Marinoscillum furvescens DSM 4134]
MNVLITGGAGYLGTELIKQLSQNPEVNQIKVYDNLSRDNFAFFTGHKYANHEQITFIQGELLDSRKLNKALEDVDVVYHLAAKVATPYSTTDPHFFEQVNHWGTAELVYAVEESNVQHFIYCSSIGVYGSSTTPLDESVAPNPRTFYAISKLRGEEHVARLQSKMKTHIIRSGNIYGFSRSMRFDSVINKFVFESNFNNMITIHGDGKQKRAFVHVDYISDVFNRLLTADVPAGTYNLIERNLAVLDIVDVMKEINPTLEFIFINQHLKLRNIVASTDLKLAAHMELGEKQTFKEQMEDFHKKWAF